MQAALGDLAGAGFERYARFVEQVHAYHREWQDFFLPKLFKRERLKADDYDRFPKFVYTEEPARSLFGRALFSLLCPLALTLVAFATAWRRLKSYSVA
jgi:ABC-2 type transport system permease protein